MNKKFLCAFLFSLIFLISISSAAENVNISGVSVPLISGAAHVDEKDSANVRVETFVVDKPLAEVIAFYSSFLKNNGFLSMGGEDPSGYNISAKKDNAMFTLKIYSQGQKTYINFIW